jgi:hypothetical protein
MRAARIAGRKLRRRRNDPRRRGFAADVRESTTPNRLLAAVRQTPADAATIRPPPEAQFSGRQPEAPDLA